MGAAVTATRKALPSSPPVALAFGLAVVVGAAVRLAHLDAQSYWFDEAFSYDIVNRSLAHVFDTVPETEFTPPLYYVLAWVWGNVFGTAEAGLRSFSVLCGAATVVVVYFAGRKLVDAWTGAGAAVLCAFNPLLVYYSQEARSYALLGLLSALTLLFVASELRAPRRRWLLTGWAIAAALALCTHYFALFFVAPQAAWLLWRRRDAAALVAVGSVAAVGIPLLLLALHQHGHALLGFLEVTSVRDRVEGLLMNLPGGPFADSQDRFPIEATLFAVGFALLAWTVRGFDAERRRGALLALGIAGISAAIPAVLAVFGFDYIVSRNLIGVLPPLCVALAAGLVATGAPRVGWAVLAAIVVFSLIAVDRFQTDEAYFRNNWRAVDEGLGSQDPGRVIVTPWHGQPTLEAYRDTTPFEEAAEVTEVVYAIGFGDTIDPLPGFEALEPQSVEGGFILARYRAEEPTAMTSEEVLAAVEFGTFGGTTVIDRPDGQGRL